MDRQSFIKSANDAIKASIVFIELLQVLLTGNGYERRNYAPVYNSDEFKTCIYGHHNNIDTVLWKCIEIIFLSIQGSAFCDEYVLHSIRLLNQLIDYISTVTSVPVPHIEPFFTGDNLVKRAYDQVSIIVSNFVIGIHLLCVQASTIRVGLIFSKNELAEFSSPCSVCMHPPFTTGWTDGYTATLCEENQDSFLVLSKEQHREHIECITGLIQLVPSGCISFIRDTACMNTCTILASMLFEDDGKLVQFQNQYENFRFNSVSFYSTFIDGIHNLFNTTSNSIQRVSRINISSIRPSPDHIKAIMVDAFDKQLYYVYIHPCGIENDIYALLCRNSSNEKILVPPFPLEEIHKTVFKTHVLSVKNPPAINGGFKIISSPFLWNSMSKAEKESYPSFQGNGMLVASSGTLDIGDIYKFIVF
jgi:hypothetical protein